MITRKELELLPEQERIERINHELEKRMKGLMFEGLYPESFGFILGKTLILYQVSKELGINFIYQKNNMEKISIVSKIKVSFADFLYKSGLVKHIRFLKVLNWFLKIPKNLFPVWHYEMDGHKLLIDEGDIRMRSVLKDYVLLKIWEPETTKIVKENVKPGMTCLDIGASIGYFTLQFCRLVGKEGRVFSFEPTEMNYNYLCENLRLNGYTNAMPYKMAAWDKHELVQMPINAPKPVWANGVAVGEFLEKQGISKVDFIKVDVDGPEPKVLKGLIKIFEKNPQLKMVIEYYPKYIKDGGCSPEEFMEILNKYFTWREIPGDYSKGCWNLYCERKK